MAPCVIKVESSRRRGHTRADGYVSEEPWLVIERILRAIGVDVTAATRTGQVSVSCVRDGAPAEELRVQTELFGELFELCDEVVNLGLFFVGNPPLV